MVVVMVHLDRTIGGGICVYNDSFVGLYVSLTQETYCMHIVLTAMFCGVGGRVSRDPLWRQKRFCYKVYTCANPTRRVALVNYFGMTSATSDFIDVVHALTQHLVNI
jgi:hypothetical protein